MNLNMETRLIDTSVEVISGKAGITSLVASRIYAHGSKGHKAAYPSVTIQIASVASYGPKEGWYRATVNWIAHTYLHDDPDQTVLRQLAGELRGLAQEQNLIELLNKTQVAQTLATHLTVMDAELGASFEESPEDNVRSIGHEIMMVARPSRGQNTN